MANSLRWFIQNFAAFHINHSIYPSSNLDFDKFEEKYSTDSTLVLNRFTIAAHHMLGLQLMIEIIV